MSSDSKWKFWGSPPKPFQKGTSLFYLGSDVGNYLRMFRNKLYDKFPKLTVEKLDESDVSGLFSQTSEKHHKHLRIGAKIVLQQEIDELFATGGKRFCCLTQSIAVPKPYIKPKIEKKKAKRVEKKAATTTTAVETQQNQTQQHMDAVPVSTPVGICLKNRKKTRTFPMLLDHSDEKLKKNSEAYDSLVPIRLDMEIEGHKLRDSFTWNKNESCLTPSEFAKILCDDLELPGHHFIVPITQSIESQLEDHPKTQVIEGSADQRVTLKLNIHVGNISLNDQIEWDLSEPENSPEKFAECLCKDLGLGGEFITAIAYSIRGQLSWHYKTLHFMEAPPPTIKQPLRATDGMETWCPSIETLTSEEMEKKIKDQDRITRRRRRQIQY